MKDIHTWVVVLAAGEGKRLSSLTADTLGRHVPKQFCSLHGGGSLFDLALTRARSLAPGDRVCAIVAREHAHWWQPVADELQSGNLIVQPRNRGTGNGVLLALATILRKDPQARLAFLPADHHVLDEDILAQAMRSALFATSARSRDIYLLGIEPDDADPELGYIIPQQGGKRDARGVRHFVEKPSRGVAERLLQQGGLWNSAIFAANGEFLLDLFRAQVPDTVLGIRVALAKNGDPVRPSRALSQLYEQMTDLDFSRQVLARHIGQLQVVPVPHCGWSDLGTPIRVTERVNLLAGAALRSNRRHPKAAFLSLAEAVERAGGRCVSMGIH
jgi:mannose-1-phosphate guanylyltransferase